MTYHNHRVEPYFSQVKNGTKTIECRIRKGKYRLIKPGDQIIVNNQGETDSFGVKVKAVRTYKTFRGLLKKEPLAQAMPGVKSVDEAERIIFDRFYTKDQETKFGVVAIEVVR